MLTHSFPSSIGYSTPNSPNLGFMFGKSFMPLLKFTLENRLLLGFTDSGTSLHKASPSLSWKFPENTTSDTHMPYYVEKGTGILHTNLAVSIARRSEKLAICLL